MKKTITLFCFSLLLSNPSFPQTNSAYTITKRIPVEGDGGWDLLAMDFSMHQLFVSHGTVVQVVDVRTGQLTGKIENLQGVHGIALAPELYKGFISEGKDSEVTVFNLKTFDVLAKIPTTGQSPDAIVYDAFSKNVFVFNAHSNNATVMDAVTNKVVATIALEGKPEMAVSDGRGDIYLNLEDKSMVDVINVSTYKVVHTWPLAPGEGPSGLALDNVTHRLFSVCDNKLMVIMNAEDGNIITTLPIGERVDGAAFDGALQRAYSSNGDGTLTVVQEKDAGHFSVLENVPTQKGARTIALDVATHHLYLPAAQYGATPDATKENPNPRPTIMPGTFVILDVMPVKPDESGDEEGGE